MKRAREGISVFQRSSQEVEESRIKSESAHIVQRKFLGTLYSHGIEKKNKPGKRSEQEKFRTFLKSVSWARGGAIRLQPHLAWAASSAL